MASSPRDHSIQPPETSDFLASQQASPKKPITRPILTELDTSSPPSLSEHFKLKTNLVKGFGPSEFHSSSTLQNSILSVSFSRAPRFPSNFGNKNEKIEPFNSQKPLSTLNSRSTTLGYGNKVSYPGHILKIAAENPAPNNYLLKSDWESKNKGKSFGLSYEAYSKVKLPHIDILSPENAKLIPGPGYYQVQKNFSFGKDKKKALLLGKGKTINELITERAPPPNYYSPKNELISNNRFKNIAFGTSQRNTFQEKPGKMPGPGSYSFKTKFDEIVEKNRFFKGFREEKLFTKAE